MSVLPTETSCRRMLRASGLIAPSLILRAENGETVEIDPARDTYPASMIKTPLAIAACLVRAAGGLDAPAPVEARQVTTNDAPSPFVAGYRPRLEELIEAMIARSDNTATNVVLDLVGRERAARVLAELGCARTRPRRYLSGSDPRLSDPLASGENEHPAADAARLFESLMRGAIDAPPVVAALRAQIWNDKLSAGLEPGDVFAHKTGDTQTVSHDGGVLTLASGARIVIVLYSASPSHSATDLLFARFMRALRAEFARPEPAP